jgi:hypothetical protein
MGDRDIFFEMELMDAFYQVRLDPESRPITNTQLPGGLFQWTVVPQGIKPGPVLLQSGVDATIQSVKGMARAYFDDILGGTKRQKAMSEEVFLRAHAAELRQVLTRLDEDEWVAAASKSRLLVRRFELCRPVLLEGYEGPRQER